jgi:hypothetical protein
MKKLVLHSNREFLPPNVSHAEILYPFWGPSPEPVEMRSSHRFDAYQHKGKDIFDYSPNINDADFVVLPTDWKRYKRTNSVDLALAFYGMARHCNKRLLVFYFSDTDDKLPLSDDAVILRTSINKSSKSRNEYALPAWSYDFITQELEGRLILREKGTKPVIGFCGNAVPRERSLRSSTLRILALCLGFHYLVKEHYLDLRKRALELFGNSTEVYANFLIRDSYYGGALQSGTWDLDTLRRARNEYFRNMLESDYVVCIRGSGNFSFRFYETLSTGRIPVFINTDCELPYESLISYRNHCVWIEAQSLEKAIEELISFHNRLTNKDFKDLQFSNRNLWLKWLSPEGFFTKLHNIKELT